MAENSPGNAGAQIKKRGPGRPPGAKTGTGKKARAAARAAAANTEPMAGAVTTTATRSTRKHRARRNTGQRGRSAGLAASTRTVTGRNVGSFFTGGNFLFASGPWDPTKIPDFARWRQDVEARFRQAMQAYQNYVGVSANALTAGASASI